MTIIPMNIQFNIYTFGSEVKMYIKEESDRVLIEVDGTKYTAYVVQYTDGHYAVEIEDHDDPPELVYDIAWDYFEKYGYFDGSHSGDEL
jgi:hypothetical protein